MIYNETRYNSQWKTKKLSQLGDFARGKSKHRPRNDKILFENGRYPLVQTGEIRAADLYITAHTQEYSEFGLQQSKLWGAGTLCITIAANIAETAILSYPMCFPDSVVGFTAYPKESSALFMHYVFTYIRNSIQKSTSGSIQDNINIDYLTSLDFKIPAKAYQDKIVSVLGTIDKKIALNKRINAELEAMAKTLYDYWFVQFDFPNENGKPYRTSGGAMEWNEQLKREIPKGWKVQRLESCLSKISTGLNPRDNFKLGNGNIRYITVKNLLPDGTVDFSSCDTVDTVAQRIIHERSDISVGDILFASIAPLGRCYLIQDTPTDWDINESVFSVRPNLNAVTSEYLFMFFMSDGFIAKASSSSTGSIFKGIRIGTLQDMPIVVPPKPVVDAFTNILKTPMLLKHKKNIESVELTRLRDWMLPMLMNGQATVSDAKESDNKSNVVEMPKNNDERFSLWLQQQGIAARGELDKKTLREIFDAMDDDDK